MTHTPAPHTPVSRPVAPLPGGGPIRLTRGTVICVHGRYFYLPHTAASPLYRSSDIAAKVRQ